MISNSLITNGNLKYVNNMAASMRFIYIFKSGNLKSIKYTGFHIYQYITRDFNVIHRKYSTKGTNSFQYCVDSVRYLYLTFSIADFLN